MGSLVDAASVPHPGKKMSGMTRRDFLRTIAAGSAAVALPVSFAGSVSKAAAAPLGQTVDITLITTTDLPYAHIPTTEEQDADPSMKAYAEAIQPWLDQNPGVKLEEISFDVYDQETLLVALSGGTAPSFFPADVLATWDEEKVLAAERSGLAADVTAQVKQYGLEEKLADYCLAVWKTKEMDGKHYALPYSYNCGDGIHYRIDQLQELGIPEPKQGWTWVDLRDMAKKLTNADRQGIGLPDWGFSLIWDAEGWEFLPKIPAPQNDWNWKWDYTSNIDNWVKYVTFGREMMYEDKSILGSVDLQDDQITSQFLDGTISMMNNNVVYHCDPPTAEDSFSAIADQMGKPVQEVFGYIAHPIGTTGYNQTSFGQLDTMGFNPDLGAIALDKATSLHVYMMGPGMVMEKKAAYEASNHDLRFVWDGGILLPLYKASELEGIPGSPEEAWGDGFMANVRAQAAIPLRPLPHWFVPPQSNSGPPDTAIEDMRSKWFYEGGDQDIKADLQKLEKTMNDQAATFKSDIPDDQFIAGTKKYYDALGAYFQKNAPDFYANVYKPWYDKLVAPTLP
ncbi:MAG: ABC transporter substrate-binding protein [Thermomicrobiales bacterium]